MFGWFTSKKGALALVVTVTVAMVVVMLGLTLGSARDVGAPEEMGREVGEPTSLQTTTVPPPPEDIQLSPEEAEALERYLAALDAGTADLEPIMEDYIPPPVVDPYAEDTIVDVDPIYTLPDTQARPIAPPSPDVPMPENPFSGPGLVFLFHDDITVGVRQYQFGVTGDTVQQRCDSVLNSLRAAGYTISYSSCDADGLSATFRGPTYVGDLLSMLGGTRLVIELRA